MGTSRLPDRIPIKSAIKLQERVYGLGGLSGLFAAGGFIVSEPLFGAAAGGLSGLLFWGGSKIKTHKEAIAEGKAYR